MNLAGGRRAFVTSEVYDQWRPAPRRYSPGWMRWLTRPRMSSWTRPPTDSHPGHLAGQDRPASPAATSARAGDGKRGEAVHAIPATTKQQKTIKQNGGEIIMRRSTFTSGCCQRRPGGCRRHGAAGFGDDCITGSYAEDQFNGGETTRAGQRPHPRRAAGLRTSAHPKAGAWTSADVVLRGATFGAKAAKGFSSTKNDDELCGKFLYVEILM